MSTLTIANSVIMLGINSVYPTPVQLQQYAADDVFDFEEIEVAETVMGVDGLLSGGFVFSKIPWSITLASNSPSCQVFDNWYAFQKAPGSDIVTATANILLPGLGYKWALFNGFLTKYSPAPSAKKLAQPRKFTIEWNSITPAPL